MHAAAANEPDEVGHASYVVASWPFTNLLGPCELRIWSKCTGYSQTASEAECVPGTESNNLPQGQLNCNLATQ